VRDSDSKSPTAQRFTALRPCLAAGLPLSCAIIALQKIAAAEKATATDKKIKHYPYLFVKSLFSWRHTAWKVIEAPARAIYGLSLDKEVVSGASVTLY
jgi:hypothetical protein